MKKEAPADGVLAMPASDVPTAALAAFAKRCSNDLGEGFEPPPTREAWRSALLDPGQRWYAIVEGVTKGQTTTVIGLVVFSRWAPTPWRSAEIGFGLDPAVVGQGVIQRSVPRLLSTLLNDDLGRIEARVDPDNERASRALSALGFRFEGLARGCLDGDGGRRTQEQWGIITADISDKVGLADHTDTSTDETDRGAGHV